VAAGALEPLQLQDGLAQKVFKGLAVLVLLTGVLELVGLAIGGRDVLQPLSGMLAGSAPIDTDTTKKRTDNNLLPFERTSAAALPQLLQHAGQPVMLDFYADWCVSCKEMERFTLSDTRVQAALRNVRWLQVDVTENTPSNKALLKQYGLFGPPAILFFDAAGRELPANRVIGFVRAERFLQGLPSFATTSDPEQPAADEPLFSPAPTTAIDPLGRLNGAALNGSAVNRGALPGIRPPATQNN
jgi:thiol:disulfide interchange protein DsbD